MHSRQTRMRLQQGQNKGRQPLKKREKKSMNNFEINCKFINVKYKKSAVNIYKVLYKFVVIFSLEFMKFDALQLVSLVVSKVDSISDN